MDEFPELVSQALSQYTQVLSLHECLTDTAGEFDASVQTILGQKPSKFQTEEPPVNFTEIVPSKCGNEIHGIDDLAEQGQDVFDRLVGIQDSALRFVISDLNEDQEKDRELLRDFQSLCHRISMRDNRVKTIVPQLVNLLKEPWKTSFTSAQAATDLQLKQTEALTTLKCVLTSPSLKMKNPTAKAQALCACRLAEEAAETAMESAKHLCHGFARLACVAIIATCVCVASAFSPAIDSQLVKFINSANQHVKNRIDATLKRNDRILSLIQSGHKKLEEIHVFPLESYYRMYNKNKLNESLNRWKRHRHLLKKILGYRQSSEAQVKMLHDRGEQRLMEMKSFKIDSLVPNSVSQIFNASGFILNHFLAYILARSQRCLESSLLENLMSTRNHTKKLLQSSIDSSVEIESSSRPRSNSAMSSGEFNLRQSRLAKALLDYEIQISEAYLQWVQSLIVAHSDILVAESFARKMEAHRSMLNSFSLEHLTSDLWSCYFPSNALYLKSSLLSHVSIISSSAAINPMPLPPPGHRLTEAIASIMKQCLPKDFSSIVQSRPPSLEAAKDPDIKAAVNASKFKCVIRESLSIERITLSAGSTVDCLLPFGTSWLVNFKGVNLTVPAASLEFSISTYPFRTTPAFGDSTHWPMSVSPANMCQSASKLRHYISQFLQPAFSRSCRLDSAIDKALSIASAVSVSQFWDDEFAGAALPELTTGGTTDDINAHTFPIVSSVKFASRDDGGDDPSGDALSAADDDSAILATPGSAKESPVESSDPKLQEARDVDPASQSAGSGSAVINRLVKSDYRRAATSVSTFGKNRPTTMQEEFVWRFHHEDPLCRVIQQFNCALVGRILLQGKMYMTTTAIGFWSVFNDSTVFSSIPTLVLFELSQIKSVKKKPYAFIFQNAIEFELHDGTIYFFASFLKRDKAWALLMSLTDGKLDDPLNPSNAKLSAKVQSLIKASRVDVLSDADVAAFQSAANEDEPLSSTCLDNPFPLPRRDISFREPFSSAPYPSVTAPSIDSRYDKPLDVSVPVLVIDNCTLAEAFYLLQIRKEYQIKLQTSMGNKDMNVSDWNPWLAQDSFDSGEAWLSEMSQLAKTPQREILMSKKMSPNSLLKIPPFASVRDSQAIFVHPTRSQVILSATTFLSGVPFCDYFHLINRFVFTQVQTDPKPSIQVDAEVSFQWQKSSIFRSKIESSGTQEWRESLLHLRECAKSELADFLASQDSISRSPPKFTSPSTITSPKIPPASSSNPLATVVRLLVRPPLSSTSPLLIIAIAAFGVVVIMLINVRTQSALILQELKLLNEKYTNLVSE